MSEFRSTTEPRTGRFTAATFQSRRVKYSVLDGMAIFEGDIALGTVAQMEASATGLPSVGPSPLGIGISGSQFRWPRGRVPYRIDPTLDDPQRVTDAIAHWEAQTSIRFLLLTDATLGQQADRVFFTSQGGCWSNVGRRGGEQIISLGPDCTTGNAIHEIGHTVGLWHEQSREDRDLFVTIHPENITSGMEHNFDQHITDGDDIGEYDYGSIMHYPANAFSKNGQQTIVSKNGAAIGQRQALSLGDIAAVKQLYS